MALQERLILQALKVVNFEEVQCMQRHSMNNNFWKMLFCLASRKLWVNWKSTKPKTLATTPQGCAMHSFVSSFADPAPFEHLEVTCCVDPPCLERETRGFQPKRFMLQLFSHLHVAESASEIIWKINQRYFHTYQALRPSSSAGICRTRHASCRALVTAKVGSHGWAGCFVSCDH